ncbi:hypothetical protein EMIT0P294_20616 [Pseudomonas sp. IT-P294]|jgi:hypothetical protein
MYWVGIVSELEKVTDLFNRHFRTKHPLVVLFELFRRPTSRSMGYSQSSNFFYFICESRITRQLSALTGGASD